MPRKKKEAKPAVKKNQSLVTAALMAEVEAKEKADGRTTKRRRKREPVKKVKPAYKPLRETKALQKERNKVYKLVEAVWKDPSSKGLRPDAVPRYIRGLIVAEKGLKDKKDWDHYLFEELFDLIEIWNLRGG